MGGNSRDKSLRGGRKARRAASKQPPDSSSAPSAATASDPGPSFPVHPAASLADLDPNFANPNPNPPNGFDEAGWGYCTEEQLEELLLKNLDFVYKEALARLVSLGYDEEVALRAILCSGHCYGSMDVLSNILHNAVAFLNTPPPAAMPQQDSVSAATALMLSNGFTDLRHLQEYSLAGMVCLLQQVRPNLTRGDAMWCLLMSDLHVGRASNIEIPAPPQAASTYPGPAPAPAPAPVLVAASVDEVGGTSVGAGDFAPPVSLCKFHAAAAAVAASGGVDVGDHRRFDLSPSIKSALRRNAFMYSPAVGFRPFHKSSAHATASLSSLEAQQQQQQEEIVSDSADRVVCSPLTSTSDVVDSVLKALDAMNIEYGEEEDPKKEMILDVIRQIRELEVQVKERKEWAQQKALQAARKLSNDLIELRMLRMEREENQRLKMGKQALEDTTMKRLTEMENALKKASGQVDRANAAVRRFETENAEIRAEMEASKLSASESAKTCAEVARREKKCLKKLVAWEKQRKKMQEEIAEERRKIVHMQQRLDEVRNKTKENEAKCKQEIKAKEQAIALFEEERRLKEAAKVNGNRRLEALRQKIELDFQRHKDDVQRLEEELARLKASAGANQLKASSVNTLIPGDIHVAEAPKVVNVKGYNGGANKPQEIPQKLNRHRECMICKKDEVSVVYLPCAHQAVCSNCNDVHEKKGKLSCPCCNTKIEERIRVYGVSS